MFPFENPRWLRHPVGFLQPTGVEGRGEGVDVILVTLRR